MTTYKIIRFYQHHSAEPLEELVALSLEQAKAHCEDPETNSKTCTNPEGRARTVLKGPWFDGWTEDE